MNESVWVRVFLVVLGWVDYPEQNINCITMRFSAIAREVCLMQMLPVSE